MSKARGPYRVDPLGYKKANEALDKKAENARELGLDYEPVWDNLPSNKDVEDAMRLKQLSQLIEQPAQQEPVAWKNAAIRLGEELSSVGPDGYYDMTAEQWLDWAMDQRPHGKNSLPAQRTWVGLTDEEIDELSRTTVKGNKSVNWLCRAIEAKLKEKNT